MDFMPPLILEEMDLNWNWASKSNIPTINTKKSLVSINTEPQIQTYPFSLIFPPLSLSLLFLPLFQGIEPKKKIKIKIKNYACLKD